MSKEMREMIDKIINFGKSINESKLYSNNIITATTNRIGDKSEDTLNKLAIAGLYRMVFGDVQQLKSKEQLDTVFNDWYNNTIENLIKTPSFIDNKELASKYLDAYIKNIKSLGSNAKPFSFKNVEQGLVDVVNNNRWIEDTSIKQGHSIHNPKSEDVVYEDDNIIILDTNTKAKCVMYGQGEKWCITKPELNYYNTYRIKFGATPYFVLQKNEPYPEHKLVIMHYKSGYAIADQTNSGNRSGGNQYENSPWVDIEREIPNLKGLEKYFPYRKITDDEIKYDEIVKKTKGYGGNNLQGYIDNVIKGLIINGSQVEAVDFIRDYASEGNKITDEQIKSLRPEVIDSLIETGYFLMYGNKQIGLLSDKQQLRVVRLKIQNGKELNYNEFRLLSNEEQNGYIRKVDGDMVISLLGYAPQEHRFDLVKQIFPLVKDKLDFHMVYNLLGYTPQEHRFDLVKQIFPLVKDKLDGNTVISLLGYTPEEHRFDLVKQIFPLVKDKLDTSMVDTLLGYTPEEHMGDIKYLIKPVMGENSKIRKIIKSTINEWLNEQYKII